MNLHFECGAFVRPDPTVSDVFSPHISNFATKKQYFELNNKQFPTKI